MTSFLKKSSPIAGWNDPRTVRSAGLLYWKSVNTFPPLNRQQEQR